MSKAKIEERVKIQVDTSKLRVQLGTNLVWFIHGMKPDIGISFLVMF